MARNSNSLNTRTTSVFTLLVLLLYMPLLWADFEIGRSIDYMESQGLVSGLSSPQAVCDAFPPPVGWVGTTGAFEGTGSPATSCSPLEGFCTAESNPGQIGQYAGVTRNYYCTGGWDPGGSSCSNISCVRTSDTLDPIKGAGEPSCKGGNPIDIASGNKYQLEIDSPSKGPSQLRIQRTYNSYASLGQSLLKHWVFQYTQRLDVLINLSSPSTVVAHRPDGSVNYFVQSGSFWVTEDDGITQLEELLDGQSVQIGWRYIEANQSVEEYDLEGKLLTITDRNGNTQTLTYDTDGLLLRVESNTGDSLDFTHDSENRIDSISDNSSPVKTWIYQYDANDNLISVTYPDTTIRQYHYEDTNFLNALTGITDENGIRFATWAYDAQGRAISSEHANGVENYAFVFNPDDSTTVTNPLGKDTTYHFTFLHGLKKVTQVEGHASANCVAANQDYTYDANGFLTSKTDWNGNTTTYIPDSRGLETSRTEAFGTLEARTITTEWHPIYRLPTKITEPELETTYLYDTNGDLLTATQKDLATLETRITTRTYSSYGLVLTEDGPRTDVTDVTTYTHYNCSTGNECGEIETVTNALGHLIQFTQYNSNGQPTHIIDENGIPIILAYDARQRLTSVIVDGTFITQIDYDNAGQVTRITEPNGSYLDYEYDDAQRLDAIQDDIGNRIEFTLDNAGNQTKIDVKDSSSVLRNTQTMVYDELGRVLQLLGANGQDTSYTYDPNGNPTSVTEIGKPSTMNQYDALNRLIQITDAESGITQLTYDDHDRLETVTDPNGLITTYTYNAFGDVLSIDSPDTGLTVYTADEAGNNDSMTDARGVLTQHSYDALNRRTQSTYPNSALDITYTYDDTLNGNDGVGRLTSIIDGSGSTSYTYNSRGLVTNVDTSIGNKSYTVAYGYDDSGQITGITYPSGRVVDYTHDSANRVTQISATKGTNTTIIGNAIDYEPFGPMTALTYGNGIDLSTVFDLDYRTTDLSIGSVLDRDYGYDTSNNIDSIVDNLNAVSTQTLDYDYLDRLTDANGGYGDFDYGYDATGNRTSLTLNGSQVDTYNYVTNTHHLNDVTGTNTQTFTYDLAGNTTTRNSITQVFDDRGRLKQSISGGTTTNYTYNAMGQRVKKVGGGSVTRYLYGQDGRLLAEFKGDTSKEFAYLNGQPIAAWYITKVPVPLPIEPVPYSPPPGTVVHLQATYQVRLKTVEKLYYFHNDHLGTPQAMTNTNQAIVWKADYKPYGEVTITTSTIINNLRFPGQYFDQESGLHYNYFRTYDPSTGRYLESDPIGLQGGLNTYGYANQNPLTYADPTGEIAFVPILIGAAVGFAFDYALEKYKEKNCSCEDAETPLGPTGNAGLGAAAGFFGPFDQKQRTGLAGGGPSGSSTSGYSRLNHAAYERGLYSTKTRNLLTKVGRRVPYLGTAIVGYEVYDAATCR